MSKVVDRDEHKIPNQSTDDITPEMADSFYSVENMSELKSRAADAKAGRNMHEHELVEAD